MASADDLLVECIEDVIDVENDNSTTIERCKPWAKRRRTSHWSSCNNRHKKHPNPNIISLIAQRQQGCSQDSNFVSNAASLKMKFNDKTDTKFFRTTHPELQVTECEFIRCDGRNIVGYWKSNPYDAIMYKLVFSLSSKYSSGEDERPSFVDKIYHQGPFFSKTKVRDMCNINFQRQNYVLYVGNRLNYDMSIQGSTVMACFTTLSPTSGRQYISVRELQCCTGSNNGHTFASGTEEGIFIFQGNSFVYKGDYPGKINSVEFSSRCNVLYCGVDSPILVVFDQRESAQPSFAVNIDNVCPTGILETKLLSGENAMVVSGSDGSLAKVDLRKRDVVTNYADHVGSARKTPFSVSEYNDLLCATGADSYTRLWSLSSGRKLSTIAPMMTYKKAQSCLMVDENRWAVLLFQSNRMYIMKSSE